MQDLFSAFSGSFYTFSVNIMQVGKMTKKTNSYFTENVRRLRRAKGFRSAEAFAETADIKYPTYRDIEAGESEGHPETRQKIARALGVTEADLFRDPNSRADLANSTERANRTLRLQGLINRLSDDDFETVEATVINLLKLDISNEDT